MSKINRELQKRILHELYEVYPMSVNTDGDSNEVFAHPDFVPNAFYLHQHGLIQVNYRFNDEHDGYIILGSVITAEGIDFYKDDGGVSAILRTITIKPDINTFLELLEQHAQTLPQPEKESLISALATFSSPVVQGMLLSVLSKTYGMV